MQYRPRLVTPPAVAPVTISAVKAQCKVDGPEEDDLLVGYIAAAVSHLDGPNGRLGRCMITQTWAQAFDAWSEQLLLPFRDLQSVGLTYVDDSGATVAVDAGLYDLLLTTRGPMISFRSAFDAPPVGQERAGIKVMLVTGFGDTAEDVPAALRQAILMLIAHWYENREAVSVGGAASSVPLAFEALTDGFRRPGLI